MTVLDYIISPIYLVLLTAIAFLIRPYLTNRTNRKYFFPSLFLKFSGAIFLGLVYEYHYGGGDTFGFHDQSKYVHDAFVDDPIVGLKLLFNEDGLDPEVVYYSSRIFWFRSASELTIIKIAGIFSLLTFRTYLGIALCFSFFSFIGTWLQFSALQRLYPTLTKYLAWSNLFIPSTIFWGSGLLKDTITLGALGIAVWGFLSIFALRKWRGRYVVGFIIGTFLLYKVKLYVLICLIPSLLLYALLSRLHLIRLKILRLILMPLVLTISVLSSYYVLNNVTKSSEKYNLDSLAQSAFITSYDIGFYTGGDSGSGYNLGVQDGTWTSLLKLAPAAVNVSLFRPYLWEVRNPLMLLSGLESAIIFLLSLSTIFRLSYKESRAAFKDPVVIAFLVFSIAFSVAVGVSTYNFGSLSRYKIPLLPFYITALLIVKQSSNRVASDRFPNMN